MKLRSLMWPKAASWISHHRPWTYTLRPGPERFGDKARPSHPARHVPARGCELSVRAHHRVISFVICTLASQPGSSQVRRDTPLPVLASGGSLDPIEMRSRHPERILML